MPGRFNLLALLALAVIAGGASSPVGMRHDAWG